MKNASGENRKVWLTVTDDARRPYTELHDVKRVIGIDGVLALGF